MRGNEAVITELNAALSAELSAIVQYMVQAEMCENWGYSRLADYTKKKAFQEMRHAESLIERVLFLDGVPGVSVELKPQIGGNVPEQLKHGLADESGAVKQYNASIVVCEKAGDNGTRDLFQHMVEDEEKHVDWLEAQLSMIDEMGLQNYLTQQLSAPE